MPTAKLTLPDGTTVLIEGTPEEINKLLSFYSGKQQGASPPPRSKAKRRRPSPTQEGAIEEPNHAELVNTIKTCDEADAIEARILRRDSQVDRTLLPLYVAHQYFGNRFGLTSGDINRITTELGIPISTPNASKSLSGTANRYVIGDKTRQKGRAVRYKLHRRGVEYIKGVLSAQGDA